MSVGSRRQVLAYQAKVRFPAKIFIGNTDAISAQLQQTISHATNTPSQFLVQGRKNGQQEVTLKIEGKDLRQRLLQMELQAPKVTVAGETKQELPLSSLTLIFHWTCYFEIAGHHRVSVVPHIVPPSSLMPILCPIKVKKLGLFTQQELLLGRMLFGLGTLIGVIFGILANWSPVLHIIGNLFGH